MSTDHRPYFDAPLAAQEVAEGEGEQVQAHVVGRDLVEIRFIRRKRAPSNEP